MNINALEKEKETVFITLIKILQSSIVDNLNKLYNWQTTLLNMAMWLTGLLR